MTKSPKRFSYNDRFFSHYILIYNSSYCFESNDVVSVKDFLLQFLNYTGDSCPLVAKTFDNMETADEMISFINEMTDFRIQKLLEVKQTVYSSGEE